MHRSVVLAVAIAVTTLTEGTARADSRESRPAALGIEMNFASIELPAAQYLGAAITVRRVHQDGDLAIGTQGSIWNLADHPVDPESPAEGDGLMARVAASLKFSYWRPHSKKVVFDFWVDGTLGYRAGVAATGAFHELDLGARAGVGYELLNTYRKRPDSETLSAYFAYGLLMPVQAPQRRGPTFSFGFQWQR